MSETLYHGDCVEIMRSLPSESVDMIFADPPFNVGKKYGGDSKSDSMAPEDYYRWAETWIEEGFRLLKKTGSFYLMTIDRHLESLFPMMKARGVFINLIKWKNVSSQDTRRAFLNSTQPILLYGKTDLYKFDPEAQRRAKSQFFRYWSENRSEKVKGKILDYWDDISLIYSGSVTHPEAIIDHETNKRAHLAQMPMNLSDRAILFSTDEGDIVLDPFNGSGTTGASCIKLNRNFIGIEKVKKYVDLTEKRWNQIRLQSTLF